MTTITFLLWAAAYSMSSSWPSGREKVLSEFSFSVLLLKPTDTITADALSSSFTEGFPSATLTDQFLPRPFIPSAREME